MYTIILANAGDMLEVAQFARQTYTQAYAGDMTGAQLNDHLTHAMSDAEFQIMQQRDVFCLAQQGGELIGFSQIGVVSASYALHLDELDPNSGELRRLYVSAAHQRQGIGSALIHESMRNLTEQQFPRVYVTTWETNQGALRLYQRHGFTKVGQIPEFDRAGTLTGHEQVLVRQIY